MQDNLKLTKQDVDEPAVQLSEYWKYFKGHAFGLTSPSIYGWITLPENCIHNLTVLSKATHSLTSEEIFATNLQSEEGRAMCLAQIIGAVQRYAGTYVSYKVYIGKAHPGGVNMGLPDPTGMTRLALLRVVPLVAKALAYASADPVKSVEEPLKNLARELAERADPRINSFMFHKAADAMGIPIARFFNEVEILGTGKYSRWFNSTMTDKTPCDGVTLAKNKHSTAQLLRSAGLPGPLHIAVNNLTEVKSAVERLGFPLVIKPNDRDRGLGVFADLRNMDEVEHAFTEAAKESDFILVEKWVPGYTHRLTVFEGKVIRVSKRIAASVTGDGKKTIQELAESREHSTEFQRRAVRKGVAINLLIAEALALLARDGLTVSHVPAQGQNIRLRRRDNINAGGTNQDLALSQIHPSNLRLAEDAARLLRLDFAGIDLIMGDIGKSWQDSDATICEINAQPQLGAGGDVSVYQSILGQIFKDGARIPFDMVVVADDLAEPEALAQRISADSPEHMVSAPSGLWYAGQRITQSFGDGYRASVAALVRLDCNSATSILTVSELIENGLPVNAWKNLRFFGFDTEKENDKRTIDQIKHLAGIR